MIEFLIWGGFIALILGLLALDLGVFNRRRHEITVLEAGAWSTFWITLSLVFSVVIFWLYENDWVGVGLTFSAEIDGRTAALDFLTAYLLEKSLSLDNIFVIALIFSYFKVPLAYQHRVLYWGVVGALVMRGVMIGAGAVLLEHFSWMTYVFGAALLLTAVRMLVVRHDNLEPNEALVVRLARRWIPMTTEYDGHHFFTVRSGSRVATPLFLVLLLVESTDLLFAFDSIPAVFAVTGEAFIVYTSNVFAILGLRSLYFVLAPLLEKFRYLKISLAFVAAYIGVKMLLSHTHPISTEASLAVLTGILGVGAMASWWGARLDTAVLRPPVRPSQLARATPGVVWRVAALVLGSTTLAVGAAMAVLPGWAVVFIPFGLAILGAEVVLVLLFLRRVKSDKAEGDVQAAPPTRPDGDEG